MKILVTGDKGYIGSVLTPILQERGHEIVGFDVGYFEDCILKDIPSEPRSIKKDIRDIDEIDLQGIDAVIHLAALSNDPLGEIAPGLTEAINRDSSLKLAECAKKAGVKRFIYSSSQSMYGVSGVLDELDEDLSEKNPVTAYARTKWEAEMRLKGLSDSSFVVVCFRPSTVFGASPRLRCDIVFNNLVACAYTSGRIEIKSDGTPWRPVIHVKDVCSAFIAGLDAPASVVSGRSYNVGIRDGNYTVRQLAEAAQRAVPGSELIFTGEHGGDSRTYRVGFGRILSELKEYYDPQWDLERGGRELVDFFDAVGFKQSDFRGRICNRLEQLQHLRSKNIINQNLRYAE
jgi:nucleoside-diphosphate-sugar epimerase